MEYLLIIGGDRVVPAAVAIKQKDAECLISKYSQVSGSLYKYLLIIVYMFQDRLLKTSRNNRVLIHSISLICALFIVVTCLFLNWSVP